MTQTTTTDNPYLLLTPGPLSTSRTVREAMLRDWCTWDRDYRAVAGSRGSKPILAVTHFFDPKTNENNIMPTGEPLIVAANTTTIQERGKNGIKWLLPLARTAVQTAGFQTGLLRTRMLAAALA